MANKEKMKGSFFRQFKEHFVLIQLGFVPFSLVRKTIMWTCVFRPQTSFASRSGMWFTEKKDQMLFRCCSYNHRIIQCFGLTGTFRGHLVQSPCSEQGHLLLDQVAQSAVQPGLECFQGWGLHYLWATRSSVSPLSL